MKRVDDATTIRALVRPLAGDLSALHDRVRERLRERPRPRRWRIWMVLPLLLAAGAVALGLVLGQHRDLDMPLESSTTWSTHSPTSSLDLTFQGQGRLSGTTAAPVVAWHTGTLSVDLEPGAAEMRIHTPEADVLVVGTSFDVLRDALGTHVEVQRGAVRVACLPDAWVDVGPGQALTCLPRTPAGLLGTAQAAWAREVEPESVLDACARGLNLEGPPDVHSELRALRVEVLVDAGRQDEALAEARACLAEGCGPRRLEVLRTAAHLALALEGCGAVGLLRELDSLDANEAKWLAHCEDAP